MSEYTMTIEYSLGVTGFFRDMKISFLLFVKTEDWKAIKTLNVKTEEIKNCLFLKTENLATKSEDWRYEFLAGKIWILSVINWEDDSQWTSPYNI